MNIKNILLIGRTGGGKSTLANTLINQNNKFEEVFKESAGSISETKQVQIKEFTVNITEDGSEKVRYLVIDTAGFGDTKLTDKEILELMSELVKIVGDEGLIQIFFVTNSRFTKEEIDIYRLLESVIFDNQVNNYTSIIKTKFPEFENEAKCEEDRQKFRVENFELARVFNANKIIYVNNPPLIGRPAAVELNKEIREESRKRLLTYLGTCQNIYQPGNLNTLNQRINDYKTQKENLQNEINNLSNQISQAESSHWSQIRNLENRHQQEIQAFEKRRRDELNRIREDSRCGWINNEREFWTIRYNWNKDALFLTTDWDIIRSNFHDSLKHVSLPLRYYRFEDARESLGNILAKLASSFHYIRVSDSKNYQHGFRAKHLKWRKCDGEWELMKFINRELADSYIKSGFYVMFCNERYSYTEDIDNIAMEIKIGIRGHSKKEYVDLEIALREASEAQEYEINSQIERIKQENRERENRLWREVENQRQLNEQSISQERQNIRANLDSVRQSSQAKITHAQQQINDAERNLERQVQQQTNLSGITGLAGIFAKMFI